MCAFLWLLDLQLHCHKIVKQSSWQTDKILTTVACHHKKSEMKSCADSPFSFVTRAITSPRITLTLFGRGEIWLPDGLVSQHASKKGQTAERVGSPNGRRGAFLLAEAACHVQNTVSNVGAVACICKPLIVKFDFFGGIWIVIFDGFQVPHCIRVWEMMENVDKRDKEPNTRRRRDC